MRRIYLVPIDIVIVIYAFFGTRTTVLEFIIKGINEGYDNSPVSIFDTRESNTGNPEDYFVSEFEEDEPTYPVELDYVVLNSPSGLIDGAVIDTMNNKYELFVNNQGTLYFRHLDIGYYNFQYIEASYSNNSNLSILTEYKEFIEFNVLPNQEFIVQVVSSHELGDDGAAYFALFCETGKVYFVTPFDLQNNQSLVNELDERVGSLFNSLELTGEERLIGFKQIQYENKNIMVLESSEGKLFRFDGNNFIRIEEFIDLPFLLNDEYLKEYINENNDDYNNVIYTSENKVYVKKLITGDYINISDLIVEENDVILKSILAIYHNRVIFIMQSGEFVVYDIDDDTVIRMEPLNLQFSDEISKVESNKSYEGYYNIVILTKLGNLYQLTENKVVSTFDDYENTYSVNSTLMSPTNDYDFQSFEIGNYRSDDACIRGNDYTHTYTVVVYTQTGEATEYILEEYRTLQHIKAQKIYSKIIITETGN